MEIESEVIKNVIENEFCFNVCDKACFAVISPFKLENCKKKQKRHLQNK